MNYSLVKNWNKTVSKNDEVYILGDISLSKDITLDYLKQLNGKIYIVAGNHDNITPIQSELKELGITLLDSIHEINYQKTKFVLCHYPLLEWNGFYKDSIHLHGHQHHNAFYNEMNRHNNVLRYDVGVDANDYKPVSINEIITFFKGVKNNKL